MSSHGFGSPVAGWRRAVRPPLVSNGMLVELQQRARRDATGAPLQSRKGLTAERKNRRKITNIHISLNNSGLRKTPKFCDFRTKTEVFFEKRHKFRTACTIFSQIVNKPLIYVYHRSYHLLAPPFLLPPHPTLHG